MDYSLDKFGHHMGKRAEAIGDLLLSRSPEPVSLGELAEVSGFSQDSARWHIFQLRCCGFVVEARRGEGYALVDLRQVSETERLCWAEARRAPAKRPQVRHKILGLGEVVFDRVGFPKVAVKFGEVVEKVAREELTPA